MPATSHNTLIYAHLNAHIAPSHICIYRCAIGIQNGAAIDGRFLQARNHRMVMVDVCIYNMCIHLVYVCLLSLYASADVCDAIYARPHR